MLGKAKITGLMLWMKAIKLCMPRMILLEGTLFRTSPASVSSASALTYPLKHEIKPAILLSNPRNHCSFEKVCVQTNI